MFVVPGLALSNPRQPVLDRFENWYYIIENSNTGAPMTTTITIKGQVTLPKAVREAVGLKPGDKVDVRPTASGGVYIEKPGKQSAYRKKLEAISKRKLIKGLNTDELMKELRGDPAEDPKL
jgi:AbrB family looped-hinge helix DNA binding protein